MLAAEGMVSPLTLAVLGVETRLPAPQVMQEVALGRDSRKERALAHFDRAVRLASPRPPRVWPSGVWARRCRRLVRHEWYSRLCSLGIVVNACFLGLQAVGEGPGYAAAVDAQTHAFFALLLVEMGVALVAFGPRNYLAVPFHWLDLGVASALVAGYGAGSVREVAFVRVLRSFRLLAYVSDRPLVLVLEALDDALPGALSALALLATAVFSSAVIGRAAFGEVRVGPTLGVTAGFGTMGSSLVTMLQVTLGADWQRISDDCAVAPPACTAVALPGGLPADCGQAWAPLFFLAFRMAVQGIALNLVAAYIYRRYFTA